MGRIQQIPRGLIIAGIVIAIIAVVGVLGKNYLLPWQIPLFKTRQALVKYMKKTHPNYHIVKEKVKYQYNTHGGFLHEPGSGIPNAYFVCDEEGFEYIVYAFSGKVTRDTYARDKLGYEIEEFVEREFLEPRGIENVGFYCTFDLDDNELPSEWSKYTGRFRVTISVRGQGTMPRDVGWLWDFYKFWCDNQRFNSDWNLMFHIYYDTNINACWDSSISISHKEYFDSKEAWYAKKTYIPNPKPIH